MLFLATLCNNTINKLADFNILSVTKHNCIIHFIISYFTAGSGVSTLAMTIYSMTKKRVSPEINAISTLLFGAVLLLLIIINVRESRQERLRERARA